MYGIALRCADVLVQRSAAHRYTTTSFSAVSVGLSLFDISCHTLTSIAPCDSSPCQNGASCDENGYGYQCFCVDKHKGVNCQMGKTAITKFRFILYNYIYKKQLGTAYQATFSLSTLCYMYMLAK